MFNLLALVHSKLVSIAIPSGEIKWSTSPLGNAATSMVTDQKIQRYFTIVKNHFKIKSISETYGVVFVNVFSDKEIKYAQLNEISLRRISS